MNNSSRKRKRPVPDEDISSILIGLDSDIEEDYNDDSDEYLIDEDELNSEDLEEEEIQRDVHQKPPQVAINQIPDMQWQRVSNTTVQDLPHLTNIQNFTGCHKVSGFENLTPFQCFEKFLPNEIFEIVARETNSYADSFFEEFGEVLNNKSRYKRWKGVTPNDMKAFVAIEIAMGLVHKPTLQSYFQASSWICHTPGFAKIMPRDIYLLIRKFLHFNDNDAADADDRLYKVRPLLNVVKDLYTQHYDSNAELSIDESMIKFKGRLFFKQYMPAKPSSKWGVKVWSLCDSRTGYLLKFKIYTGKETESLNKNGLGYNVVQSLLEGFENKGHVLFTDSFYTGVPLYNDLRMKQIGASGTVRANRKHLPVEMKKSKKFKKGDPPRLWINKDKNMLACSFQDTGSVNMISTIGDAGVMDVEVNSRKGKRTVCKPTIQGKYNKYMGGVDKFDQYCSTYPFNRKSQKWYQCIWHFIIETALVNSYICYLASNQVLTKNKMPQSRFRNSVINGMLDGYKGPQNTPRRKRRSANTPMNRRLDERHFISQYETQKQKPNCVVCSILPSKCKKRGKGNCKRRQTNYYCKDCPEQPSLCIIPCFKIYHTQVKYEKCCQCDE